MAASVNSDKKNAYQALASGYGYQLILVYILSYIYVNYYTTTPFLPPPPPHTHTLCLFLCEGFAAFVYILGCVLAISAALYVSPYVCGTYHIQSDLD